MVSALPSYERFIWDMLERKEQKNCSDYWNSISGATTESDHSPTSDRSLFRKFKIWKWNFIISFSFITFAEKISRIFRFPRKQLDRQLRRSSRDSLSSNQLEKESGNFFRSFFKQFKRFYSDNLEMSLVNMFVWSFFT